MVSEKGSAAVRIGENIITAFADYKEMSKKQCRISACAWQKAGAVRQSNGWLEWCNTLYEPDAYYNVYGKRLTLQQYKDMMSRLFQYYTMELGQFDNMLVRENWCAIRYTVKIKNLDTGEEVLQNTMKFVEFKDNGGDIGVRVVEGWALSDSPLSAK